MKPNLEKISNESLISINDYIDGYLEWKEASNTEKEDFYCNRIKHVLKFGGVFFDSGTKLTTSGSSLGLSKKYIWGPNFQEAKLFHDYLCFGDLDCDLRIALFFNFNKKTYNISKSIFIGKNQEYTCYLSPEKENLFNLTKFIKSNTIKKNVIIKIIPTQTEILFRKEIDFFIPMFNNGYIFHSTGEICNDYIKTKFPKLELRDTMKIWNGGASFYTCKFGNLHWEDFTSKIKIENAELISTDLFNLSQIFYNNPTGDMVSIATNSICACGLPSQSNSWGVKACVFNINNNYYDWLNLKKDFIQILNNISGINDIDKSWEIILGLNFGISDNLIVSFYETTIKLSEITINSIEKKLSSKWGVRAVLRSGLKHNHFKSHRIFKINEDELLKFKIKIF